MFYFIYLFLSITLSKSDEGGKNQILEMIFSWKKLRFAFESKQRSTLNLHKDL